MITLAPKCRVMGISTELLLGLIILDGVYAANGDILTIYHIIDGEHMPKSLHYIGNAADVSLPEINPKLMPLKAQRALGVDYDYVIEDEHAHLEFQPKRGY